MARVTSQELSKGSLRQLPKSFWHIIQRSSPKRLNIKWILLPLATRTADR